MIKFVNIVENVCLIQDIESDFLMGGEGKSFQVIRFEGSVRFIR